MLVKELFLTNYRCTVCKKKKVTTLQVVFKNFAHLLGTAILRNNSSVLTGQDHIHSIRDFQSKTVCSTFDYTWCSSREKFGGN